MQFDTAGTRLWGTYFGGSALDYGYGVTADLLGNVFISGETQSTTGIATADAHQLTFASTATSPDAYMAQFNTAGAQVYGTYLGGTVADRGHSIAYGVGDYIYMSGGSGSLTGISTPNSFQDSIPLAGVQAAFLTQFANSPPPLLGGSPFLCAGDSTTLFVNGTFASYAWELNGVAYPSTISSITVTQPGTYSVVATDAASNTFTDTLDVVLLPAPFAGIDTVTPTADLCDGNVVVLKSDSVAVAYRWLLNGNPIITGASGPTFTVVTPGNYTLVTSNAAGCTDTSAIVVVSPFQGPTTTITAAGGSPIICPGSSLTLTAVGGTVDIWSDGTTGQSTSVTLPGNYWVKTTNVNGCTDTAFFSTFAGVALSVTQTALGALDFCQGGSVTLSVPSFYLGFQWQLNGVDIPGATQATFTATQAGTYLCLIQGAGNCQYPTTNPMTVTILPAANVPVITQAQNILTIQNPQPGVTYTWQFNGATVGTGTPFTPAQDGLYTLLATIASGCDTFITYNFISVGIGEPIANTTNLTIFPNPSAGQGVLLTLTANNGSSAFGLKSYTLADLAGRVIESREALNNATQVSLGEGLSAGTYTISVTLTNGEAQTLRLVVVR
jgi:hypothetical protein